jgi:outer membrane protein assembly factor BamB
MMKKIAKHLVGLSLFCLPLSLSMPTQAAVQLNFQYVLSNFSGPISSQWAKMAADLDRGEIYAFDPYERQVRIFNEQGMEIFSFGEDGQMNGASDLAVAEDGSIYVLTALFTGSPITRLNYRGEPVAKIDLTNLPENMRNFKPSQMEYARGALYLLDAEHLQILVADTNGLYQTGYDLREQFESLAAEQDPEKQRTQTIDISGFSVDAAGIIYFTTPMLFSASRLNPAGEGTLEIFGRAGSGPGKFGVVAGIAADRDGNIYISDRLRSVVMVFDKSLNFVSEFGYRGYEDGNLTVPNDIVLDNNGKIYVSQGAGRGVSCYRIISQ